MAFTSLEQLNEMHLDVLTEIGNIGSGNAATALATLLNKVVDIEIPQIFLLDYDKATEVLGGKDLKVLGSSIDFEGDLNGMMLQITHQDFASALINTFYERHFESLDDFNDMDFSVMQETGNITTAAYVNSIATMTNTYINIAPPKVGIDTVGNFLDNAYNSLSSAGRQVLYIDETLFIQGTSIKSAMVMLLELKSTELLFEKLGIAIEE
ncbi:MAG: chemotaxis protein CheC [Eubacterium sp.]|nr:chemotaxis protein CheC [Eubacterium sp.]